MAVLLVTYDLNTPGKNYEDVLKAIKNYAWAQLSESSYAINTYDSPQQIFDKLKPLLDKNDNLYVIPLKKPYAGFGPKAVNDWLNTNLSY